MATHMMHRGLHFYNYTRGILCRLNSLCVNNQRVQPRITPQWINVNGEKSYSDINDIDAPCTAKKKKPIVPRISLLSETDEMSVVTLDEAQKIAKRRDLKLIKIIDFDTKTERPIYKLMTMNNFVKEEKSKKSEKKEANSNIIKEEKAISISSKIAEHDLNVKIKSIHKMLRRRHGVRAIVSIDGNETKAMQVAENIATQSKDVATIIKNKSGSNVKIILRPILNIDKTNEQTENNSDSSKDNTQ